MFVGTYRHTLDAKGRLNIPKRFQEPLSDPSRGRLFFGTRGLEACVFLFVSDHWERVCEQVRAASLGSEDARGFSRLFFSNARELPMDASGRILVPPELRQLAGVDRDAVLVGVDRRIELWSPQRWEAEEERNEGSYEQQAKGIFPG